MIKLTQVVSGPQNVVGNWKVLFDQIIFRINRYIAVLFIGLELAEAQKGLLRMLKLQVVCSESPG